MIKSIDLLWTEGQQPSTADFSTCAEDLELEELSGILFPGLSGSQALSFAQGLITADPDTLRLRQEGIRDLMEHPVLADTLERAMDYLKELHICVDGIRENAEGLTGSSGLSGFKQTLDKLERLFGTKSNLIEEQDLNNYYGQLFRATIFTYRLARAYTNLLALLKESLTESGCQSEAMTSLLRWVEELSRQDRVEESAAALRQLSAGWEGVGSFAVDVLVDQTLQITGMELQEVRPEPYPRGGVLTARSGEDYEGLSGLSEFPMGGATARFQECLMTELGSAMQSALTKLRNAVCRLPVSGVKMLLGMEDAFLFYTGAACFLRQLREKGFAVCCPEMGETCWMEAKNAYPVSLPLLRSITPVTNDIRLPADGTVNFITGANSAGKTTFLIMAGQLQWLFQLGCWLPCEEAVMRPADGLYTLFASGESDSGGDSRMGLEAQRIRLFRERMTQRSLILLNEPMTSTNASEGIEICINLLYDLIQRGVSAMMVTHYNEIYTMLRGRLADKTKLVSCVMEVEQEMDGVHYPYRIRLRNPDRSSYAHEIVKQVGVTLDDMLSTLSAAGLDMHRNDGAWTFLHPEEEV